MAARIVPLIAAVSLAALTFGPLLVVLAWAEGIGTLRLAEWQAVRFTLWQAFLSALASCLIAVPIARALARRRFPGRSLLITFLGAPFILPVIVAVMGLLAVFGQSGLVNIVLNAFGVKRLDIYGLHGVVVAHVFFNLPLAVRILLQAWLALPQERFRLADALGLGPKARFLALEWPLIRRVLPGAFGIIFVICLTSFAVALTLGGGPRATTVELAIYQAMRFDFEPGRAAALALLQLGLGFAAGLVALWLAQGEGLGTGLDRRAGPRGGGTRLGLWLDCGWLSLASGFLLVPLAMVILRGVAGLAELDGAILKAAWHSILVSTASTVLCLLWALPLAGRKMSLVSLASIAISPLVLGTGLFLILRPVVNPFEMALPVTAVVNALMALPFALRILSPEAEAVERDYGRLRASLRLTTLAWLRWVWFPRLRRPLGFAAGLTAALAMGDLGVIALFADPDHATLPLQVYRLMGSYRMDAAAGAALLLMMLSLGVFWLCDRGGRVDATV